MSTNPQLNQLNKLNREQRELYDEFVDTCSEEDVAERMQISSDTLCLRTLALCEALSISSRAELVTRWAKLHK